MSADSETSIRSSGFHPKIFERAENLQLPALTIGPDPSEMLPPAVGQLPSSSDSSSGESDSFSESSGESDSFSESSSCSGDEKPIDLHDEAEEAAQALQHASLTQSGRVKSRQLLTASESQRQRIYVGQVAQIRARLIELIQRYEDNSELISQWLVLKDHLEEVLRLCGFDPELIDSDAATPPPADQSSPLVDQSSTLSVVASSATPSRLLLLSDVLSDAPPAAAASAAPSDNDAEVECSVCWSTVAAGDALSFDCGHAFCTDCWRQHVEHAINGGDVLNITCMDRSCQRRLLDADVQRLVSPDNFARYQMFELASRMRQNPNAVWCPADNCSAAFEGLQCPACQTRICPDCKRVEHSGMTCRQADKLDAKKKKQQRGGYFSKARREERRNKRWLQRHTMACIHCSYPIQKNGGCKHVTCGSCHRDFCWSCLRDWREAGGYDHICMFVSHGPLRHKCYRVVKDIGLIALWTPIVVVGAAAVVTVGAVVLVGSAVVLPVVMLTK